MNKPDTYKKGRGSQINPNNKFSQLQYEDDMEFKEHCFQTQEEEAKSKTSFIPVYPKSIVNEVNSPDIPFKFSMNPYQGCEHGCIYCYARTTHEFWGYSAGQDFEEKILVKQDAVKLLEKKLRSKSWKAQPIMLSGNTDCYQPIERKLKITRQLLEVCHKFKQPVGIITKNALLTRDIDLLADMAKDHLVRVAISITSLDEKLRGLLEPRTSTAKAKLKAMEKLSHAGIPVQAMMAPIIPGLNSSEVFEMAKAVAHHGAMGFNYTMIRLNGITQLLFEDWVYKNFPNKANKVLDQIRDIHGGELGDHRFGTRMSGEGKHAESIKQMVALAKTKFNLNSKIAPFNTEAFIPNPNGQLNLF